MRAHRYHQWGKHKDAQNLLVQVLSSAGVVREYVAAG